VLVDKELPPLDAEYHNMELPVAVKLLTVGLFPEQKDCAEVPVGADGIAFMVANTDVLLVVVHPLSVAST
jgi:hypothetical protein